MEDGTIGPLNMVVGLAMSERRPSHINLQIVIKFNNFASRELHATVSDDCIHHLVMVDDLLDEVEHLNSCNSCYGFGFNPLCEFVNCHK